jgi:hypothetical protein
MVPTPILFPLARTDGISLWPWTPKYSGRKYGLLDSEDDSFSNATTSWNVDNLLLGLTK